MIIKYTKQQYQAKVTELEGFYNQLVTHEGRMTELKSEMFQFWDDPNAQKTAQILTSQLQHVHNAMDQIAATISFYKSAIDKLSATGTIVDSILEKALGILAM